MHGDGEVEAKDVLNRLLQIEEAVRAGVGLVAHHDGRPLLLAHRPGPGVGQKVDVDVRGPQAEHVVAGPLKGLLALLFPGDVHGLDHLDAEGLGGYLCDHSTLLLECTSFTARRTDRALDA